MHSDDVPITSVVAPPGYGKTTLLSEWAHRADAHVAWLSLDRYDNDLKQFVSYAAAALGRVEPIDRALLRPVDRHPSVAAAASSLAAVMESMNEPVTLMLDHVESLENDDCLDTVAELALHLPPGARLALATRVDPPIPVPRLRAGGEIVEVGVDDLAMDDVEARRLLEDAGVLLTDDDLAKVIARTEGWPVGLYLAALALKSGASSEAAGLAFTGDDRLMAEYLRAELLDHMSDEEVTFLTRTAILERMSGRLCDAVLEANDSAQVLQGLAHSNLLLVALDRQGEWYRYHHLFRDLLRGELLRRDPAVVPGLHIRASDWCNENGLTDLAISHAEAGGDSDRTNRLLLVHAPALYASGRIESVSRWLTWFAQRELVEDYPALAVLGGILFSTSERLGDMERWAAAAEYPFNTPVGARDGVVADRGAPDRLLPDGSTLEGWRAVLRMVISRQGVEGALRDAKIADQYLSERSGLRPAALAFEALAEFASGNDERADAVAAHCIALALDTIRMPAATIVSALRGVIAADRGDWIGADEHSANATQYVESWALDDYAESAFAHVLAARVALHHDEDVTARERMLRVARLRPLLTYGRPLISVPTLLEAARVYAEMGDTAGAREVIRQCRDVLRLRPDVGVLPDRLDAVERRLETMRTGSVGASSLTAAELRLVPYLPTHLTFAEIAQRLHVSRNTAKTQAISIYQKVGVSSRSAAVEQLTGFGLLD